MEWVRRAVSLGPRTAVCKGNLTRTSLAPLSLTGKRGFAYD